MKDSITYKYLTVLNLTKKLIKATLHLRMLPFVILLASLSCQDDQLLSGVPFPQGRDRSDRSSPGQIYFISNHDGTGQLYVMNDDGSGIRQLTRDPSRPIEWASLSKNQRTMIVVTLEADSTLSQTPTFYSFDLQTNAIKFLFRSQVGQFHFQDGLINPVLSPDGREIVFTLGVYSGIFTYSNIFKISVDGTDMVQLTNNFLQNIVTDWSNDGSTLLGSMTKYNVADSSYPLGSYAVMAILSLKGDVIKSWADTGYSFNRALYSHSGRCIAFESNKTYKGLYQDIFTFDLGKDSSRDLIKDHKAILSYQPCAWSPEDSKILCNAVSSLYQYSSKNPYDKVVEVDVASGQSIDVTPSFVSDSVFCTPVAWKGR